MVLARLRRAIASFFCRGALAGTGRAGRLVIGGASVSLVAMMGNLHRNLPEEMREARALPGVQPLDSADWLRVDEAFAGQMAERARLLRDQRSEVVAVAPDGRAACDELLEHVIGWLAAQGHGYQVGADKVRRPDGAVIPINRADPMGTLGHLVQEDLCLMEKRADQQS